MDSPIEEIKSRLDLVEIVSQYIKLRKTGANFNAICPFHSEKSGSFFVSPTRQTWKCFGCGKGGDIFTFVQEIEGIEFGDALRILAQKAGVELKRQTPETQKLKTERQRYYEICELSAQFYEKQLSTSPIGKEAKQYLLQRGLTEQSIAAWRLGYAPDAWQTLHDFLASQGYTDAEIIGAGVASSNTHSQTYDRFRNRIMFPIFDFNSQIVGFGGRIFENKNVAATNINPVTEAKYLNTSNTLLYDKSKILYGLDRAKIAIRHQNACVLVEGYTDVIMSAQIGVENVVATSGTALTSRQLQILKRFTDNIILGYDMDLAGDTANSRGIEMALNLGFNVSVARPPYENKDPADVITIKPEAWRQAVANPKAIMDFYFERAFASHQSQTPQGKRQIASLLLPHIKRVANTIEQSYWLQKLARDLCVREEDLRIELKKVKLNEYSSVISEPTKINPRPKTRQERLEERLLVLFIKFPETIVLIDQDILNFFSENGKQIINALKNTSDTPFKLEGQLQNYFNDLALLSESEIIDIKDAREEIECHLFGDNGVRDVQLKEKHLQLALAARKAQDIGDQTTAAQLKEQINSIWKEIGNLKLRNLKNDSPPTHLN